MIIPRIFDIINNSLGSFNISCYASSITPVGDGSEGGPPKMYIIFGGRKSRQDPLGNTKQEMLNEPKEGNINYGKCQKNHYG